MSKRKKRTSGFWYYFDGLIDVIVIGFVYVFKVVRALIGGFLKQ